MYDDFSANYDRFVDWPSRLAAELPFIEQQLQAVHARRVLDTACGTGMHAIALAQRGYEVAGADLSAAMIERAQANARAAGADVQFEAAGFGESAQALSLEGRGGRFDAVLCLGNSLPHLLTPADLAAALADFAACLEPGGLLLIQNRNFDAVLARRERWMEPQTHREDEKEWLFLRFYDFESDGLLTFNLVTLRRGGPSPQPASVQGEGSRGWEQRVMSSWLWPLQQDELVGALIGAGFVEIACWGDMEGNPFDLETSGNLVATARRGQ